MRVFARSGRTRKLNLLHSTLRLYAVKPVFYVDPDECSPFVRGAIWGAISCPFPSSPVLIDGIGASAFKTALPIYCGPRPDHHKDVENQWECAFRRGVGRACTPWRARGVRGRADSARALVNALGLRAGHRIGGRLVLFSEHNFGFPQDRLGWWPRATRIFQPIGE